MGPWIVTSDEIRDPHQLDLRTWVNGELRQQGDLNQMIWKVPEMISRLSELFVLQPGDMIYTGTPAGVGPVLPGDQLLSRRIYAGAR